MGAGAGAGVGNNGRPWMWKDDRTAVVIGPDGVQKEFTLLPADPRRVERFRQELALARSVTLTLLSGRKAFENGSAEYSNAVRRLKKLNLEFGKALDEQLAVAQGVGVFFAPGGVEKEFGPAVDVLTEFSAETIERALRPPAPAKPEAPRPPKSKEMELAPMPDPAQEPAEEPAQAIAE